MIPGPVGLMVASGGVLREGSWLLGEVYEGDSDTGMGMLVFIWSVRFSVGLFAAWNIVVVAFLVRRIGEEEAMMRRAFGSEWDRYVRRVGWKMIPGLW